MARYVCTDCRDPELPDIGKLCESAAGSRWWLESAIDLAANAVIGALKVGFCGKHSALIGDLVCMTVREERARRIVQPGTVKLRHVRIDAEPFELLPAGTVRRNGLPIVERVEAFVRGSVLSAIVEIDMDSRRGRVTLQLGDENPTTTVMESTRLVHLSAAELAASLRSRREGV